MQVLSGRAGREQSATASDVPLEVANGAPHCRHEPIKQASVTVLSKSCGPQARIRPGPEWRKNGCPYAEARPRTLDAENARFLILCHLPAMSGYVHVAGPMGMRWARRPTATTQSTGTFTTAAKMSLRPARIELVRSGPLQENRFAPIPAPAVYRMQAIPKYRQQAHRYELPDCPAL